MRASRSDAGSEVADHSPHKHHLQTAASGTIQNVVGKGVGGIAAFVLIGVVTRSIGASNAGIYFEAVALVTIVSTVGTLGAEVGVIRDLASAVRQGLDRAVRPTLFVGMAPTLLVALVATVILEVFAPEIARAMGGPHLGSTAVWSVRLFVLTIPLLVTEQVLVGATRGLGSAAGTPVIDSAGLPGSRLALAIVAALTGSSLWAFAVAWSLPALLCAAAAAAWVWVLLRRGGYRSRSWWGGEADRWELARQFWRFSLARGLASVFQVCTLWFGVLLVGWWSTTRQAAMYGVVSRLAVIGTTFLQALALALAPLIASALSVNDRDEAQELYQSATGWIVALGVPIYAVIAVFSPAILTVFGHGFRGAAVGLTVVAIAMVWNLLTGPVTDVLLMGGRSTWNMWNTAVTLVVMVGMSIALIPQFGANGAAVAWAAAITIDNTLPLFQVRWRMGMHPFSRVTLETAVLAIVIFGGIGGVAAAFWSDSLTTAAAAVVPATGMYLIWLKTHASTLQLPMLGASAAGMFHRESGPKH